MNVSKTYTFENFNVDRRNSFAHFAAVEASNSEKPLYNPIFIYGPRYEGKTHLLMAIENRIKTEHPEKSVLYADAEDFYNEMISAIKESASDYERLKVIRKIYRDVDVLIVDNIEFFMDKERTITEFFFTFEDLYLKGKQIVLSADRKPTELGDLDDCFGKRLEMGLVVSMGH
ncbi:DnaA ATPase domain-containing protein [Butyrivibrio sp. LC3010]|uniref:DnaA ATPase domain-containing protein n=1 Tax=Butyrivibrio sp. LC3010 TaxID=1280680 RepID=UPI0018CB5C50|nr:DnaA/Hda family protein [Butyrivibrio sp. LC3010]